MKKFALAAIAALVVAPVAAQEQKHYALDGGVRIALSAGWSHKQMQNPAMQLKSMREMMVGASDTRIKKGNTGILISYMHFKAKEKPTEMSEEVPTKN